MRSRLFYNLAGLWRYALGGAFANRAELLKGVESRPDYGYIKDRVDYYNRLDSPDYVGLWRESSGESRAESFGESSGANPKKTSGESSPESAAKNPAATQKLPPNAAQKQDFALTPPFQAPTTIANFKIPKNKTSYFFDAFEILRYFSDRPDARFTLESGDVNYCLSRPAFCKSRPIFGANHNNVLLNLDKFRHFRFVRDRIPFEKKDDILFFRGGVYQPHRVAFLERHFGDSRGDLGHTGSLADFNARFKKPKANLAAHLRHKFILSLEGNDVASNLKWIMSSNSIAVSPPLRFETWFMEGRLKGDFHYIEIAPEGGGTRDENGEDCGGGANGGVFGGVSEGDKNWGVFEKLEFYAKHPALCEKIIANANAYCAQFMDEKREIIIALLVAEKYFRCVGWGL